MIDLTKLITATDKQAAALKAKLDGQRVSMRQARLALLQFGKLDAVTAAIAAMTGAAGDAARIEWEFATEVQRTSPLIAQLAAGLGLASADLDALFTTAVTL
jgi:hypothetical protein